MNPPGLIAAEPTLPHRPSTLALRVIAGLLAGLLLVAAHAAWAMAVHERSRADTRALVRALDLTDPAWFTEARYIRHLSQADLHTAFQDGPGAPEHFPGGALVAPPRSLAPAATASSPDGGP